MTVKPREHNLSSSTPQIPFISHNPSTSQIPCTSLPPHTSQIPFTSHNPFALSAPFTSQTTLLSHTPLTTQTPLSSHTPLTSQSALTSQTPLPAHISSQHVIPAMGMSLQILAQVTNLTIFYDLLAGSNVLNPGMHSMPHDTTRFPSHTQTIRQPLLESDEMKPHLKKALQTFLCTSWVGYAILYVHHRDKCLGDYHQNLLAALLIDQEINREVVRQFINFDTPIHKIE